MTNFSIKTLRKMKGSNNSVVLLIAAAIVIVIILIALIAFLVMKGGPGTGMKGEAELASFFPENTMMYAELNVSPEKFKELQKISGDSFSLEKIAEGIKEAAKNPGESIETMALIQELNKTLEPKVALGLWDLNAVTSNPEKMLIAAVVKEPENVPSLFEKASKGDVSFTPKTIDGVEYFESSQSNGGGYVIFKNVLLISDKIETLQDAITFHKDGKSNVLSNPEAKNVLDNLQPTRIFTVLINTAIFTEVANKSAASGNAESFQQFLNTMSYTGIGFDLHSDVVEGKIYSPYSLEGITDPEFKSTLEKVFSASSTLEAPKILPENSVAFVSLSGVSYLIDVSMKFLDPNQKSQYEQTKQMVQMFTGLSLESDVIPLFSDELTVAGRVDGSEPDIMMVITAKDTSMQVLNKVVGSLGNMDPSTTISDKSVGGSSLKVVSTSQSPVDIAYGEIGKVVALGKATTIEALAKAASEKKTLANSPVYSGMGKYVPEKVSFAMYVDYERLAEAAKVMKAPPAKVKEFEEMSKNVSALVFTAGNKDNKAIEGSLLMKLKQK